MLPAMMGETALLSGLGLSGSASGLRIASLEAAPLVAPLREPFTIASARLDAVHNVAVRLELSDGAVGYGEVACLPPVTAEDAPEALAAVRLAARALVGECVVEWSKAVGRLGVALPGAAYASSRAGVECALLDALAKHKGIPLREAFGGKATSLRTDITVPICAPELAQSLAEDYARRGFGMLKTKTGGRARGGGIASGSLASEEDVRADVERVLAIRRGAPGSRLLVDANCGWTGAQAAQFLALLNAEGVQLALLEQPTPRGDLKELKEARGACQRHGVLLAVDEDVRNYEDARRIIEGDFADVLNLKLAKCGVVDALKTVALAQGAGKGLMLGGMVETRLAMGFAATLAAGTGAFEYIDLDTPLLLAKDPIARGGVDYAASAPDVWDVSYAGAGHGMRPKVFDST